MYNQQPTNQPILLLHSTASMCMWCMRRTGMQWRHCSATTASGSMPGPRQPHSKIGGARSLPGVRPHGSCRRGAAHGLAACSVDPRLDPVGSNRLYDRDMHTPYVSFQQISPHQECRRVGRHGSSTVDWAMPNTTSMCRFSVRVDYLCFLIAARSAVVSGECEMPAGPRRLRSG